MFLCRRTVTALVCVTNACVVASTEAFQLPLRHWRQGISGTTRRTATSLHLSSSILDKSPLLLAGAGVDQVSLETFNALNGATDATSSGKFSLFAETDPAILAAEVVAAIALLGLAFVSRPKSESASETNGKEEDRPSTTIDAPVAPPPIISKSTGDSVNVTVVSISEDEGKEEEAKPKDDLSKEKDEALAAFDGGDRVGLLGSLQRITGLVRSTRKELSDEVQLREDAQEKLKAVAEDVRDLEDKYELGQNKLTAATKELQSTQSDLIETQKKLQVTSDDLQELQEERKSLRKLGKVAWDLSKERVKTRIQKIRGKATEEVGDGQ